jgi:hypothetical protein
VCLLSDVSHNSFANAVWRADLRQVVESNAVSPIRPRLAAQAQRRSTCIIRVMDPVCSQTDCAAELECLETGEAGEPLGPTDIGGIILVDECDGELLFLEA